MRNHLFGIIVASAVLLAGCSPPKTPAPATPAPPAAVPEVDATDVAWATGLNIWKVECPSPDITGVEALVLDEKGTTVAGAGMYLAVHHQPGKKTLLRLAFTVEGKSLRGRFSAGGISTAFHYPDVLASEYRLATFGRPNQEGNTLVFATQRIGQTTDGPPTGPPDRRIVLRLKTTP